MREKLDITNNNIPLYRYTLPGLIGKGHAYGPKPPTQNRSLVGRCTHSLPVVWIPALDVDGVAKSCSESEPSGERDAVLPTGEDIATKKGPWCKEGIIYMKDTWRFLSDLPDVQVMPEHKIYEILHKHNTLNIPEHVAGGDVERGKTSKSFSVRHGCVKLKIPHSNTIDSFMGS